MFCELLCPAGGCLIAHREQQLANYIRQKEFLKAAEIAFNLDQVLGTFEARFSCA